MHLKVPGRLPRRADIQRVPRPLRFAPLLFAALLIGALALVARGRPTVTAQAAPTTVVEIVAATPTPTPELAPATPTSMPATPTVDATKILAAASVIAEADQPLPTDTPTKAPTSVPTPEPHPDRKIISTAIRQIPGAPIRMRIPSIGIDAPIESVGITPDGSMATPTTPFRVAWFENGTLPGQQGNAVIDGHLDSAVYGAAVFWRLRELHPGDKIMVEMPASRWLTFQVTTLASYPYNNAPIAHIFGTAPTADLNLITCSGYFNHASHNYDHRLVVYSKLI